MNWGGGQLFDPLQWQSFDSGLFYHCLGVKDNVFVSKPVCTAHKLLERDVKFKALSKR